MARTLFDYKENRLDYGSLLMPEIGCDLDFAVAFTYSLDLEALLGVPLSMGLLEDMDTGLKENPFFLLEAIRKSSDKLAIFCNSGCIALPRNIRSVFALLENSVFEVKLSRMKNFHPKMWFIKYTNDNGESYIKLIVLSRNLTFDNSFDYAVEMSGKIGRRKYSKNRPLSEILKFAAGSANASHKAFHQNVEFLLKLKFRKYMAGYENMLRDFLPDESCPFELVTTIEADEPHPDTIAFDKAFREAIRCITGAKVTAEGERYRLTVHTNGKADEKDADIAPLFRTGCFRPLSNGAHFDDMLLREVSEFFVLRMEDKQSVIKIKVSGMPQERDRAVYRSIIKDKNDFLAYLSFALSDNYAESCFEQAALAKHLSDSAEAQTAPIPVALYERMLRTAVNAPHRLLDLEKLMQKLGDDIVNEDFKKVFKPFKEIAKRVKR